MGRITPNNKEDKANLENTIRGKLTRASDESEGKRKSIGFINLFTAALLIIIEEIRKIK